MLVFIGCTSACALTHAIDCPLVILDRLPAIGVGCSGAVAVAAPCSGPARRTSPAFVLVRTGPPAPRSRSGRPRHRAASSWPRRAWPVEAVAFGGSRIAGIPLAPPGRAPSTTRNGTCLPRAPSCASRPAARSTGGRCVMLAMRSSEFSWVELLPPPPPPPLPAGYAFAGSPGAVPTAAHAARAQPAP